MTGSNVIKVIIFDYYGVIAQDAFWYQVNGIEAGKHKSEYIQKLSEDADLNKISWSQYCDAVAKDMNLSVDVVQERYNDHRVSPGIVELISSLGQKYRVAVLSNASAEQLLPVMTDLGLDKLFERIFVSSEIKLIKPNPEIFIHVAKELGVEASECVMIDDAKRNIHSAMALGMQGIVFENTEACSVQLQRLLSD